MTARKTYSLIFFGLLVATVAASVVSAAATGVFLLLERFGVSYSQAAMMIILQSCTIVMLPVFWLFVRRMPKAEAPRGKIGFLEFFGLFFAASAISELLYTMSNYFTTAIYAPLGEEAFSFNEYIANMGIWEQLILVVLLAPVLEELIFRKLFLSRARVWGDGAALVATSVAFGLLHGNIEQIPYAVAMGFALGYIMLRTNNILLPIAFHMLNNLISVLSSYALEQGAVLESVVYVYLAAAIALGVLYVVRRHIRGFTPLAKAPEGGATVKTAFRNAGAIVYIIFMAESALFMLALPYLWKLLSHLIGRIMLL